MRLKNRIIELLKLDLTTILTSLSWLLPYYLLGGFLDRRLFGIYGVTYVFQFLWSLFNELSVKGILIYAFNDLKDDINKRDSAVFSGFLFYTFIILLCFIFSLANLNNLLDFYNISNELKEICYIYYVYDVIAIGLQCLDFMCITYYEYTDRVYLSNKLSIIYTSIRLGSIILCILFHTNTSIKFLILTIPLFLYTIFNYIFYIKDIYNKHIKLSFEFLKGFKYIYVGILEELVAVFSQLLGTKNMTASTSNSADTMIFQYSISTTAIDMHWDCISNISKISSIDLSKDNSKYENLSQLNDTKVKNTIKLNLQSGFIVWIIASSLMILTFYVLSHFIAISEFMVTTLIINIIAMFFSTIGRSISSVINILNGYKILLFITLAARITKLSVANLKSQYSLSLALIASVMVHCIANIMLYFYYTHKYKYSRKDDGL